MNILGYFVHEDYQELNPRNVMVIIDAGYENLLCYYPIGQYCEASREYFNECIEITKEEYIKGSRGFYTPKDYLK